MLLTRRNLASVDSAVRQPVRFRVFLYGNTDRTGAALAFNIRVMTISDIVNTYCEYYDLGLIEGKLGKNDPAPILAFLIADCAFQEFCEGVKPLGLKHDLKKKQSEWLWNYHTFNKRLFICLDEDQKDFVIDMMDLYEEFIQNDVMLMRVALMNLVGGCEFEDQKHIASLMLCNIFAQTAQITWGLVFKDGKGRGERAPELDRMRRLSHTLTNSIALIKENINPNADNGLKNSVEAFMNKTVKWLDSYEESL